MDEPLLQTKLYIPQNRSNSGVESRVSRISRPHLMDRLNEGLSGKLALISAPAGFGKTTLISDWLEQVDLTIAWLSLDEDDNDFARFWIYFIASIQTVRPEIGAGVLAMLRSSPLPHSHTLLTPLINDLTKISERLILVLDDYHSIETESIDQSLDFFIEHLPPSIHLVITSRADPNLSLARNRANRQLNELRGTDLRFTQAETAQFLERMTGLSSHRGGSGGTRPARRRLDCRPTDGCTLVAEARVSRCHPVH